MKKPFSKRLNKRKASKVTFRTHRTNAHSSIQDDIKVEAGDVSAIRPEDIKFHQNYQ